VLIVFPEGRARLALAHLPQSFPDALLGLTGLSYLPTPLALQTLHGFQKPHCFWLAK
jgi:hypothetical protein